MFCIGIFVYAFVYFVFLKEFLYFVYEFVKYLVVFTQAFLVVFVWVVFVHNCAWHFFN